MSPLDATRFDVSGMPREAASLAIAINGCSTMSAASSEHSAFSLPGGT